VRAVDMIMTNTSNHPGAEHYEAIKARFLDLGRRRIGGTNDGTLGSLRDFAVDERPTRDESEGDAPRG